MLVLLCFCVFVKRFIACRLALTDATAPSPRVLVLVLCCGAVDCGVGLLLPPLANVDPTPESPCQAAPRKIETQSVSRHKQALSHRIQVRIVVCVY